MMFYNFFLLNAHSPPTSTIFFHTRLLHLKNIARYFLKFHRATSSSFIQVSIEKYVVFQSRKVKCTRNPRKYPKQAPAMPIKTKKEPEQIQLPKIVPKEATKVWLDSVPRYVEIPTRSREFVSNMSSSHSREFYDCFARGQINKIVLKVVMPSSILSFHSSLCRRKAGGEML